MNTTKPLQQKLTTYLSFILAGGGKISFLQRSDIWTLGLSTTTEQTSCSGVVDQHIINSTGFFLCVCVCFYLLTFLGFTFILFSLFGRFVVVLSFFIFEKGLTVGWIRRSRGSGRIREKEKNSSKTFKCKNYFQ